MTIFRRWGLAVAAGALAFSFNANAQEKHYRFATTSSSFGLQRRLRHLFGQAPGVSGGKMLVDHIRGSAWAGAQLLQLVKSGDLDFAIVSSANTATISPQAGVMSLHFLFRDENHMVKALADPKGFRGNPAHDRPDRARHPRDRPGHRVYAICTAKRKFIRSKTSRA